MIVAVATNLPISELTALRIEYRLVAKLKGMTAIVRYRGPRFDHHKMTTLKQDATGFSVYFR